MSSRDYAAEFTAGLRAEVPEAGEFVPAVIADAYVTRLQRDDPHLLNGWLLQNAAIFATAILQKQLTTDRMTGRRRAAAREFAQRVPDVDFAGSFSITYKVADDNTRIRVGDMTALHHRYVAGDYEASAKTDRMLAAFHRAIAKKVGGQRTADVLTEAEYDALYRSIVRAPAVGAA